MSATRVQPRPECGHCSTYRLIRADGAILTICAVCREVLDTDHSVQRRAED
jgi:hypothetical protein